MGGVEDSRGETLLRVSGSVPLVILVGVGPPMGSVGGGMGWGKSALRGGGRDGNWLSSSPGDGWFLGFAFRYLFMLIAAGLVGVVVALTKCFNG